MDISANKMREGIPLGKQAMEITFAIIIIIYLLPKKLCFSGVMDQKIRIEMSCYHNDTEIQILL